MDILVDKIHGEASFYKIRANRCGRTSDRVVVCRRSVALRGRKVDAAVTVR